MPLCLGIGTDTQKLYLLGYIGLAQPLGKTGEEGDGEVEGTKATPA